MKRTVDWKDGKVVLIDQTKLPQTLEEVELETYEEVASAIKTMVVRGAPAIGATAALGIALAARNASHKKRPSFAKDIEKAVKAIKDTRPTAVNLFWAVDRMVRVISDCLHSTSSVEEAAKEAEKHAVGMLEEDEKTNKAIGKHGAQLVPDKSAVLTHCNAGALACVGYGTALGVIRSAVNAKKKIRVYADETRPRLQGMKLTCFELLADGIPVTVISDNMAGHLMAESEIDLVVVGADRIAANGDVINKIGTYSVAVLAHYHGIPFYVAAPTSTIDLSLETGYDCPIEERDHEEVTHIDGLRIAPEGVHVVNPSFDVTPSYLISAIVTENGILRPPFKYSIGHEPDSD